MGCLLQSSHTVSRQSDHILSILQIPMPTGVPITLQTFAMALCGYVLGWQSGVAATLLYIVLGTVGVPIFAGMSAGPGVLFGYTGGFIFGFIFLTLLCGISVRRKNPAVKIILGVIGLLICHLLGAVQYAVLAHITIGASLVAVSLPYCKRCDFSGWCLSGCHCCP